MSSNLKWKAVSIVIVVLISIYGIIGLPTSWTAAKQNFAQRIKLGLDLQGGTHLILQVQVQEAVNLETDQTLDHLKSDMRDKGIRYDDASELNGTQIVVHNLATNQTGAFRDLVSSSFPDWDISPAPNEASGYVLSLKPAAIAAIGQQTMDQSVETITRRIDNLGLTQPLVATYGQGNNEIIVELPGESDPNHAKEVIQATARLELTKVVGNQPYPSEQEAMASLGGVLPPDTELLPGGSGTADNGQPAGSVWYLVQRTPIVTGRDLKSADAEPSTENPGYYDVAFHLSTDAATRFGPFTEQNVGNQMATVLNNQVILSAVIKSRIEDSGVIEGQFGQQQADDLALELRSGALPASVKYLEESTIGPSLGADSIRHGVQASVVSLLVVLIFMVAYYRQAGVNAVVALLLNLVILLAALGYFSAVLTLPGIAGVILTIGMGVDSNVLIFERIREELRSAKAPVSAVDLGFKRAFLTIIDTHVTTLVSAAILFVGVAEKGAVAGFAVTLTIGLLANLFTSVYVSRVIFDWHLAKMPRQAELSI